MSYRFLIMATIIRIKKILPFVPYFLNKILLLTEFFLLIRFILKWLNASAQAFIVNIFYIFTDVLVWPFDFIFPNVNLDGGGIIDIISISSMVGYAVLVLIILGVLKLFYKEAGE